MKAIIFARVSSREQEESGYSLASQERLLTEYAKAKGFEIEKIFNFRVCQWTCAASYISRNALTRATTEYFSDYRREG